MAKCIIRLDDIAPNMHWENYKKIKYILLQYNILPIIGVIPDNQDESLKKYPNCENDFWEEIQGVQSKGWSIAIHGYQHKYDTDSKGILGINPRSEFAGHSYGTQLKKIRSAIKIFQNNKIFADAFMAPSHSFDEITLKVLSENNVCCVTDGYGLFPYKKNGILFVPQLFAKPRKLPYGVFTFCLHLNTMDENDLTRLEQFIVKNKQDIIPFSQAKHFVSDKLMNNLSIILLEHILKFARAMKKFLKFL
ncbi:DUF2334 domain-containing protein [Neobacillus sp. WH10]|uniref:DUF2334 domain-containing protein n=1 Tax=Neobacillus sp. WH10 TaxID=3047873 RepID=UPI0024C19F6C|nr:DUF2334 domain-containing protein [Neobacillus sp. WH10]WHY76636.1 DUF2334 domain-containing protein [Neobacillus sp. WH10]